LGRYRVNPALAVRRLLLRLVTAAPGGLGSPSVPTKRDCLNWLDAARTKAGESLPDRGPSRAPSAPGSYGPGDRKAASGAPRGARAPDNGARHEKDTGSASRRSAPSHVAGVERGTTAYPAPPRIRAMMLVFKPSPRTSARCWRARVSPRPRSAHRSRAGRSSA
jgi:hypothetical protein